jgi:hypothetical protein
VNVITQFLLGLVHTACILNVITYHVIDIDQGDIGVGELSVLLTGVSQRIGVNKTVSLNLYRLVLVNTDYV